MWFHLSTFAFEPGFIFTKLPPKSTSNSILLEFLVSVFILKAMTHFRFIFVNGTRQRLSYIILYMVTQFYNSIYWHLQKNCLYMLRLNCILFHSCLSMCLLFFHLFIRYLLEKKNQSCYRHLKIYTTHTCICFQCLLLWQEHRVLIITLLIAKEQYKYFSILFNLML